MTPTISFDGHTNVAVHWAPYGYHPWVSEWEVWINLLKSMHVSWVVIKSDDDAVLKPLDKLDGRSVVQLFLDNKINPVVRFEIKLDRGWPIMNHVEELVAQFDSYGLSPLVPIGNEPGNEREWAGDVPEFWPGVYISYFMSHGMDVVRAGGVALFAGGPGWPYNPFYDLDYVHAEFDEGWMGYSDHFYGLNRPPNWPYDSVTQTGGPLLTERDLVDWFGPFYDDKGLNDVPLEVVNYARTTGKRPGLTAIEDDTCWRGWELAAERMKQVFGKTVLMCQTEGGWTPGAIAGGGSNRDLAHLRPTPDTVAEYTIAALRTETPLLFQASWLLGDSVLGGSGGWDMDAWCTGWWRHGGPRYWYYMPIIDALKEMNEGNLPIITRLEAAQVRIGRSMEIINGLR